MLKEILSVLLVFHILYAWGIYADVVKIAAINPNNSTFIKSQYLQSYQV